MPARDSRSLNKGRTKLGLELEAAARNVLAHLKGEKTFPTRRIVLPDEVDVKRIRTSAGMTQIDFARAFHIELRTLQDWEQGRRKPDATSRAYLSVIQKNKNAVIEALNN
ncbi:MAG: helix-turn-helix domain-containing protein [Bryobacterales bacterium]|nr:helix-turn-helix domain-containing protein [Bryobacterales bacterium]